VNLENGACRYLLDDGTQCSNSVAEGERFCTLHSEKSANDLKVYDAVLAHFRQDISLFWTRADFYLVVQAGLLSVTVNAFANRSLANGKFIIVGLCTVGLSLTIFWYLVMRGSTFWLGKWREQVIELDTAISRFKSFALVETQVKGSPSLSPSRITQYLPLVFVIAWVVLGILVLFSS